MGTALAACGVIVAVDQGTKALATSLVSRGDRVEVLPFLAFENVRNKGVAFGIGGDISAVFIGATIIVLLGFLVYLAFRGGTGWLVWLPAALLIGGALGNLADRARDGAVTDFIDLPLWPTFNLADVAIVVGVLLLAAGRRALGEGPEGLVKSEAERLIVHLDDDLAVIEKPAGLVVHSAPSHKGETLVDLLEGIAGGGEGARPGIVHRLDKDTSGLMLVARNDEAHRELARMVKAREVVREYTALVEGRLGSRTGTIDAPLGRDRRQRTKRAVKGAASREARTHFEVIETLPADTLAHARLETGRTHQIRVHFAAIGHPVAGDPEYGSRGRHGLERQFLHASRLRFRHPNTGKEMEFTSELPTDLRDALERARKS